MVEHIEAAFAIRSIGDVKGGVRRRAASSSTPNDPYYTDGDQAHYDAVGVDQAWGITAGDASVIVQVIDSGIDEEHPDLQVCSSYAATAAAAPLRPPLTLLTTRFRFAAVIMRIREPKTTALIFASVGAR